jgi:hypothetical protein
VDKFIYLGSYIHSEIKIGREMNSTAENTSNFWKIIKGTLWNRVIVKQHKTVVHKVCCKLMLIQNAETWTLTKRNKSKIQTMDMKLLRNIQRKIRSSRIVNEIFKQEGVI